MITRSQTRLISSLKEKKYRQRYQLFVAEGDRLVEELLGSPLELESLFALPGWIPEEKWAITKDVFHTVDNNDLSRISNMKAPHNVVAVFKIPLYDFRMEGLQGKITLALEDLQDPGNMGTIIRLADWFGIGDIICSEDSVDAYNPKVIQASMGSIARVRIHYLGLKGVITGYRSTIKQMVYGATLKGEDIYKSRLEERGLILLGNEAHGLSEGITDLVDRRIAIPAFGGAESLNVAVAAAIICAEFRRQTTSRQ